MVVLLFGWSAPLLDREVTERTKSFISVRHHHQNTILTYILPNNVTMADNISELAWETLKCYRTICWDNNEKTLVQVGLEIVPSVFGNTSIKYCTYKYYIDQLPEIINSTWQTKYGDSLEQRFSMGAFREYRGALDPIFWNWGVLGGVPLRWAYTWATYHRLDLMVSGALSLTSGRAHTGYTL